MDTEYMVQIGAISVLAKTIAKNFLRNHTHSLNVLHAMEANFFERDFRGDIIRE